MVGTEFAQPESAQSEFAQSESAQFGFAQSGARVGFALFETPVGCCGVAWRDGDIVRVALPARPGGRDEAAARAATRAYLAAAQPDSVEGTPPPEVAAAIDGMIALLAGEPTDLTGIRVDLDGLPEFHQRVYEVTRAIPPGSTLTYGEVAARLGMPGAAQAVGQALGRNPVPIIVPCHRVLAAGGALGGFSAPGGAATKQRILRIEGALPAPAPALFDDLFADSQ
ncbi:methylated-DNA--[protein]-cysteine S-methyltransferase [Pseudofrankia sp. DC12]|uniref:methylated-DNA--[protein]-cysteine S-methyltransferase n=1 Tax=Pseudofrankia sp. DC12 TaxID=683315 RepID=UPI0009FF6654|nr:methylated-DNA--[protein]-cysteine S-methyltransferase [Pseudofrankia sp. DC12]